MKFITNYILLFLILLVLGIFYKKFEEKRIREEEQFNNNEIQKFLLDDVTLAKSKKPILWIHVPYEYNSRNWLSFGSRSSFDLNQPYLYLTVKSIIKFCEGSFTICIIDDNSFEKLIPNWSINMKHISSPVSDNVRTLGLMNLLYRYGGLICPISFVCMKDLKGLYERGINNNKMGVCETIDRNVTSSTFDFYPNINFSCAPKNNQTVKMFIDFIERTISTDYTAASVFLGDFNRWINKNIEFGHINLIPGTEIGIKTVDNKQIVLEQLLSQEYLNLYPGTYGILIPANEILNRTNYQWFARLSAKQVLESNTIIGSYLLLSNAPTQTGILEPLEAKPDWVGFWKTPLYDIYMVKQPNYLGNNLTKVPYPRR